MLSSRAIFTSSRMSWTSPRLDEVHPPHHEPDLVGLEVADEVDPGPVVGVVVQMGGELLDPVLPADGDPGGDGRPDGLRGLDLGGGLQSDVRRVPAGLPGRLGDALPHHADSLFQCHFPYAPFSFSIPK